ncbi:MAG TPA: Ldh family oxidoreductase [Ramlibacter sp.]|nr:Ldh family oxidoreductase [Ramlibacter sp.]
MKISIPDSRALALDIFARYGVASDHSEMIADHLIYAEASGESAGGMARVLGLIDELEERPRTTPVKIEQKSRSSAVVDGGGHTGYITSVIAMDKAMELAKETGFGLVGLRNSWFSGQLSYYVGRAAEAGLISIHCTNAKARVAPAGGIDAILGTNPIAFGFPCDPQPVVIDIGTSSITVAQLLLRQKLGQPLDSNVGIDRDGNATTDPAQVWVGALLPWGGHRGYGIALAVHLLGMLGGGKPVIRDVSDTGFFFLVIDPETLMPLTEFRAKASGLVKHIEASRPAPGVEKVRVHGMASAARRAAAYERGYFEIDDSVYQMLVARREGRNIAPVLSNKKGAGQ